MIYAFTKIRLCVLLVLFFTTSILIPITPAFAILIDFETYPWGSSTSHLDPVNTQFSSWGISLINSEDDYGNLADAVIGQYGSSLNYPSGISALAPWVGDDTYYGTAQAPIDISFNSPIDYFSVYAMDVGYNGLFVGAYNQNHTLISSISIDGSGRDHAGPGLDFIKFTVPGISSISFSQIHGPDDGLGLEGYLLDDMTIPDMIVSVPDASIMFLLSPSLIILGLFSRKKSRKCIHTYTY